MKKLSYWFGGIVTAIFASYEAYKAFSNSKMFITVSSTTDIIIFFVFCAILVGGMKLIEMWSFKEDTDRGGIVILKPKRKGQIRK
jgi:hypothetical protein